MLEKYEVIEKKFEGGKKGSEILEMKFVMVEKMMMMV